MNETIHATCPSCSGINRVRAERLASTPVCGKCGAQLLPSRPLELDGPALARFLTKNDLPVLVDFWSSTCGPCAMMAPEFERAATRLAPRVRLAKLETMRNQSEAMRHNIRSVPTLVLFRGGAEVSRVSGALPADEIVRWTESQT